jgi:hypothetical protein
MLYALWIRVARFFGLVPRWEVTLMMLGQLKSDEEYQKLVQQVKVLTDEKAVLQEENQSLWMLLEEMGETEILSKTNLNDLMEDLQDTIVEEMLRDFDPIGEA